MSYRGDDLDLRTPQANPTDLAIPLGGEGFTSAPRARSSTGAHSGPIWVDQTVLDCCNHAFDVASAHRAPEVRLEHLIYALTRVDEGIDAFEARGIQPAALRRQAASVIATDIPVDGGSAKTLPNRSDAMEEVLRLASAAAYRRQAPVNVSDILRVLFDGRAEFSSFKRLLSSVPRIQHVERTFEDDVIRDRVRAAPPSAPPPQRKRERERDWERDSETERDQDRDIDLPSIAAEKRKQSSRLDALEQSIRDLSSELANERKSISGVLQDLQRELMAQREETTRLGGITPDKIQAVFGDRLQSLEQAFLSSRGAANGDLQDRLSGFERTLTAEIVQTRAAIETLATRPGPDLLPLSQRIEVIEDAVLSRDTDQRLAALEAAVDAERERAKAADEALLDALARQPAVDVEALVERIDASRAATTEELAEARERIDALEKALAEHANRSETSDGQTAQDLSSVRDTLSLEFANTQEGVAKLSETFQNELSELHVGLAKVNGNQHTIATAIDAQAQDAANAFGILATRIESLEKAQAKPVEMLEALSGTVDRMHRITVERYYRRNRFWYWLFGTDDWLAASWPSQSARIAEELRSVRR